MPLPTIPLPESSAEVNGTVVPFRSLSRSEALAIQGYRGREDEAEVFILSRACDVTEDEARAFRDTTPAMEAGKLIDGILVFSGLASSDTPEDEVPDPKSAMNGHSWTEVSTVTSSS
jgi:hypothetical protein